MLAFTAIAAVAVLAFVVFHIWFSWTGYIASDDRSYAQHASRWVEYGSDLSRDHWGLRHVIVLPTAVFFKLFGESQWTLAATDLVYTVVLLGLVFSCAARAAGNMAGLIAIALVASVPMIANGASSLAPDNPEAAFVIGSLMSFHYGLSGRRKWMIVLSGALAGLALSTRETSLCLLFLYFILFVAGYKGDRRAYSWLALGLALTYGAETLVLWAASGDPLYRLHLTVGIVGSISGEIAGNDAVTSGFDSQGLIASPRWLKPILMMLANQQIGPILWFAIPAAISVTRSARRRPELELARLLALLSLLWFVWTTYVLFRSLVLVPRYETVSVVALAVCLAIWLSLEMTRAHLYLAAAAVLSIIGAGVFFTGISDRQVMFPEQQLVSIARETPGRIWTDPVTYDRAQWLLSLNGDDSRVMGSAPPPGGLYVFNSKVHKDLPPDWNIQKQPSDWTVIARYREPPRPFVGALHRLAEWLGVWQKLPEAVIQKLEPEPRTTVVLRAAGTPG